MERIVVGVDGSDGAAGALRWAVEEGRLRTASVTAVLTWGYLDQAHVGGPDFVPGYGETDARLALEAFVSTAVGDEPPVPVEHRVVCDLAAPGLLSAAEGADLVVVGARGLGGFRGLLLGSVSQQVLHHATCPVAITRATSTEGHPAEHGRVVVGVDGSETSRAALEWALDEARFREVEVEVVHSWLLPYGGYSYGAPMDPTPMEEAGAQLIDEMLAQADVSGLDGRVHRNVCADGARNALLDAAARAAVVVVGSNGVGGFRGMLLGSVSHAVAQHAPCPVVVIPPPG